MCICPQHNLAHNLLRHDGQVYDDNDNAAMRNVESDHEHHSSTESVDEFRDGRFPTYEEIMEEYERNPDEWKPPVEIPGWHEHFERVMNEKRQQELEEDDSDTDDDCSCSTGSDSYDDSDTESLGSQYDSDTSSDGDGYHRQRHEWRPPTTPVPESWSLADAVYEFRYMEVRRKFGTISEEDYQRQIERLVPSFVEQPERHERFMRILNETRKEDEQIDFSNIDDDSDPTQSMELDSDTESLDSQYDDDSDEDDPLWYVNHMRESSEKQRQERQQAVVEKKQRGCIADEDYDADVEDMSDLPSDVMDDEFEPLPKKARRSFSVGDPDDCAAGGNQIRIRKNKLEQR